MLCPKCNHTVAPNDLYCRNCGCSLKQKTNRNQSFTDPELLRKVEIMVGPSYDKNEESIQDKYFNADGRLNRKPYIIRLIILQVIGIISEIFIDLAGLDAGTGFFLRLIRFMLIGIPGITLLIRRLHDLNRNGWLWLLIFVPFVNLLFLIYVFCFKGTVGPNEYGPDPLDNSGKHIAD